MRNPYEYPVTTAEIIDVLQHYIAMEAVKQQDPDAPIGDNTIPVLEEAIRRIRSVQDWHVARQDDSGNQFPVREGLSETDARRLKDLLEARGHKQTYFAGQEPKENKVV